ncbi:ShlB/FhaC/HecB family hemolysin secretion/activation protein [Moorena sp. SIOASIH]|uniref:ShlB/FhaC/HecB family hemolysin secretion/activation protein n=1 Tax=Moorena sp. SIOASIH TaxID=2607817 RepID=UPI0025D97ED1|nr:ShlB/FhaC/HecB family hemolysin secretion/activation protein [Moorena sp. SIOASIH]
MAIALRPRYGMWQPPPKAYALKGKAGFGVSSFSFSILVISALNGMAQSTIPNSSNSPLPITSASGLSLLDSTAEATSTRPPPQVRCPVEDIGSELIGTQGEGETGREFWPICQDSRYKSLYQTDATGVDIIASSGERFLVKTVEVLGSTVLQEQITALIEEIENQEVTFEDLIELRSKITQLYIKNGYITSGAFLLNNQALDSGTVQIQVVEGEVERIELNGLNRLRPDYVRRPLEIATTKPLNQQRLVKALQLLQLDPLIERVNVELTAGSTPGRNILKVTLKEAPAFHTGVKTENNRSPSIGSTQVSVFAAHDNLLGFGDRIRGEYGLTEGLDIYDIRYSIPINARKGTLSLGYSNSENRLVSENFRDLNIRGETQNYSLSFRQPLLRSPETEFAVGVGLDLRHRQTFILDDIPLSFSLATADGTSKVTVIRLFQDWVKRSPERVLAARSQFSLGIDAFDATISDSSPDGRFFTWVGQFQWVEQLSPSILLISRINTQLTPDSLLSLEKFSLGGRDTVRGYRQNQIIADNAILGGVEARILLTSDSRLQLTPFFEIGTAWNNDGIQPNPATIAGVGLGLRWQIGSGFNLRLDYGIPLIGVDNQGNSLQDNGIYFTLDYQPF